ncbi:MAG: acetyl-CoA C-acyltransferase [Phycisphaerae bacterium]|jgi:3-oxoadipyl-CoA thiolase|nr:acetyl-CoA C-acyltransferase [Phycisphaerae bacterium]MCZ2401216.1 acetyl-CoA C-acyltransferase [Phycisphaerae bacterium]NUQ49539.1 acetyl-CoA C-acyltransferase [Phycisphaerae bacterium]
MRKAAIVAAVRTPVGRYGGALAAVRPDDLAALVIRTAVERAGVDPVLVEDVYLGAANQAGEDNRNVARMAALLAGLPETVAGCTVNRLCASGLEALNIAARTIESGCADVVVAGGAESMTRAPLVMAKAAEAWQRTAEVFDTTIGWRFTNPKLAARHHPYSMGETAENVAERCGISRADQDRFALESQARCKRAQESGRLAAEIVPVEIPQKKGPSVHVEIDEHPRGDTTLESLARLRPAFRDNGTVTAGNSSGINDGAAALVLVELKRAQQLGLRPIAIVGPAATAGVDPACMGLGPVPASRKLLKRAGLTIDQLDHVELNEAFAAQALACIRQLGLDPARTNPNGGAIALGHPLGMSGARLAVTIVHEMQRRPEVKRALATLCVGVGQGVATLLERA